MNPHKNGKTTAQTLQTATLALDRIKRVFDSLELESSESLHETLYGLELALIGATRLILELDGAPERGAVH